MTADPSDDSQSASQDMAPPAATPGRTPLRSRAVRIGGAVLLVLLGVFATHPWWLARVWAARLAADSGRAVRIERMTVGLAEGGGVRLTLTGVHVANAPWAGTSAPMADLREATFVLGWDTLFAERKDVVRLVLVDGSVDLRRLADGRRNWRLRNPDDTGPGRYRILALEPHRLTLAFDHRGVDLALTARATDGARTALAPAPAPATAAASGTARGASVAAGTSAPGAASSEAGGAAGRSAGPLTAHVAIDGAWRGVPMAFALDTGPVLSFVDTGASFPLRGTAAVGGVALRIDGTAGDLFRAPVFDADLELSGRSLAALAPFIGERWPEERAFRVAGRFTAGEGRFALAAASATVGRTDLSGDVAWVRSAEAPGAAVVLSSRRADWTDLAWLLGRTAPAAGRAVTQAAADARASRAGGAMPRTSVASAAPAARSGSARRPRMASASASAAAIPASGAASESAAPASAGAPASAAPDPRQRLARWSATVRYDAAVFRIDAAPQVQRLSVSGVLEKGMLTVPSFEVGAAGGRLRGSGTANVVDAEPAGSVELQASGFRLETLLGRGRAGPRDRATGALSGRASLAASGRTADALLASLRGRVSLDVRDGSLSGLLDAQLGLSPGRIVRRVVAGDEAIALPCAHATLDVRGGTARIASLVVASARTRTTGRGTIDLDARTLDVLLTPEPVGPGGWFDLDRSIRLTGPLGKPDKQLVGRVAIASSGC